jgi:Prophage CP4-57 regulatory protein (AlpA)
LVMSDNAEAQSDELVFFKQLNPEHQIPFGSDYLRGLEKRGEFPLRRRIGLRRVAWLKSEILAYKANLQTAQSKPVSRKVSPPWAPKKKMGRPTNAERAARAAARAAAEGKAGGGS